MKVCSKCKIEKPETEFGINKNRKDGLNFYCKKCVKEISRISFQKNYKKKPKQVSDNKICCSCKTEKPKTEFYKTKHCQDGKIYYSYRHICKKCHHQETNRNAKIRTLKNAKFCKCGNRLNNGHSVKLGLCKECYKPIATKKKKEYGIQYMRKKNGFKNIQRNPIKHLSVEELREYLNKQHSKMWWDLKDSIIKTHICKRTDLRAKDIPQELVELKKATMLLKRALKTQTI